MKFDETKTKKNPRDVTEPSLILLGLWNLQNNEFWMVSWLKNHEIKKKIVIFNHKTIQQLIVLEVLRPQEYEGRLRHISGVLFGLSFIKFHGLGPEL